MVNGATLNEAEAYERMKAYSPYDNVDALAYPPLLVTTGLHDSQVQYWEPMKWVARLRELRSNHKPLIMHLQHGYRSRRCFMVAMLPLQRLPWSTPF